MQDVLRVGHPGRPSIRTALLWCLTSSLAFTVLTVLATQDKPLRVHSPWQDDPYDVVVSFTQLVVPVLAAAVGLRALRCRRELPLPVGRAHDLLRAARTVSALILATAAVEWVAVAVGAHRPEWDTPGRLLIVGLVVLTTATLAGVVAQIIAHRRTGIRRRSAAAGEEDWAEDLLVALGDQLRQRTPGARWALRGIDWIQRVIVDGRHGLRRHPVLTALSAAGGVSLALAVTETISEDAGGNPGAALAHAALTTALGTSGLFAILLAVGSYLRVLRPASATGHRPVLLTPAFAAASSVPVSVALRDRLGALAHHPINDIASLAALVTLVAVITAVLTMAVQITVHQRRR